MIRVSLDDLSLISKQQFFSWIYRARQVRTRSGDRVDAAIAWLLIGGLAWVPFWYGSNALPAWGINAVLFSGLAVCYELALLVRGRRHPVAIMHVVLPATMFAAALLWGLVQTATWVPSPLVHPIWRLASETLGLPVQGSISVNRDLTELALLRLLTVASVFWLALQLSRDIEQANRLIAAIAAIGALYAIYGLLVLKTGHLPWLAIDTKSGMVSSTFYNRDSYATYAGLGLVASGGILLRRYREHLAGAADGWRHQLVSFIEATGQSGAASLAGCFLIIVALLLTGSRGGVIATGLGLAILIALTRRRGPHSIAASMAPKLLAVFAVAAILFVFGDMVASSLEQRGIADSNRLAVYLITLRSILDAPLVGFGYGTFGDVFPMYRDRSISVGGTWGQAHNTYLEVFQGLGLVFGSLLIGAVVLLAARCARAAVVRRRDFIVPGIASGAACLVGVHALVDFSLQMQAVAITFAAMLGAGVAQSESSRRQLDD